MPEDLIQLCDSPAKPCFFFTCFLRCTRTRPQRSMYASYMGSSHFIRCRNINYNQEGPMMSRITHMLTVHIEPAFGIKVGFVAIAIQTCYEFYKSVAQGAGEFMAPSG